MRTVAYVLSFALAASLCCIPAIRAAEPRAAASGKLPGLRKLMETPLRDTSLCRGPEGTWYLTGTVEPFWAYNEGIKLWKSNDLVRWEPLGFVWKYGASPWHEKYLKAKKPLWAPEVHYLKGTFWLTYSCPGWDGTAKTVGTRRNDRASGVIGVTRLQVR